MRILPSRKNVMAIYVSAAVCTLFFVCSAMAAGGYPPKKAYDPPSSGAVLPGEKATGGNGGYGYADQNEPGITFNFVDISGTGTPLGLNGADDSGVQLTLGAPFRLYGVQTSILFASVNGFLSDVGSDIGDLSNDCPVAGAAAGARILALHDDLVCDLAAGGEVYYQYFATSPIPGHDAGAVAQAASVIMWSNVRHYADTVLFDLEVILFHTTGEIFVQIGAGNPELGSGSTTGMQDASGDFGLTYACNVAGSIPDDTAVAFLPQLSIVSQPDERAGVNEPFSYDIIALPIEPGDTLTITAPTLPLWLTLTDHGDGTAQLAGTPTIFDLGTSPVVIQVEDQNSNSVSQAFDVTVVQFHDAILNSGFETGDFTGWIVSDLASPHISMTAIGGGFNSSYGFFTTDPTEGDFAALNGFDGEGPGTIRLEQEVLVPEQAITLEFDYRAGWDMFNYGGSTQARTFKVLIENASKAVLEEHLILTAEPGTANFDTGVQAAVVDISAFAGQNVTIAFEWWVPEDFTGPAQFQLDDVVLTGKSLPAVSDAGCAALVILLAVAGALAFLRLAHRPRFNS